MAAVQAPHDTRSGRMGMLLLPRTSREERPWACTCLIIQIDPDICSTAHCTLKEVSVAVAADKFDQLLKVMSCRISACTVCHTFNGEDSDNLASRPKFKSTVSARFEQRIQLTLFHQHCSQRSLFTVVRTRKRSDMFGARYGY